MTHPKKECENCGDEFEPRRTSQKFCSDACAEADAMVKKLNEDAKFRARKAAEEKYL